MDETNDRHFPWIGLGFVDKFEIISTENNIKHRVYCSLDVCLNIFKVKDVMDLRKTVLSAVDVTLRLDLTYTCILL